VADVKSETHPFPSRFGAGWLTQVQYLAENMTARVGRKHGVDLPAYFWKQERWAREYALQCRHAAGLLRLYSLEAIVRALRTQKGRTVYSLGAKFILDPLIRIEQEREDHRKAARAVEATPPPVVPPSTEPAPAGQRPAFVPKTTLGKLKDL
jgi:hypothetical protein